MKRSRGRISKKSRVIGRKVRSRVVTVAKAMKKLEVGQKVQIVPYGKFEDFPHLRYAGRVGTIVEKQGDAYIVRIDERKTKKYIIASPIHLRVIG